MTGDSHPTKPGPREPLYGPESASAPVVGISGGSGGPNRPQTGAESFESEREAANGPETDWTPPPPGDTREQLPNHILAAIQGVLGKYFSTACHTATACQAAAYRHDGLADELRAEAERLHTRCRINQKFTGQLCVCVCHDPEEPQ